MRDGLFKNARIPPPFKTAGDTLGKAAIWADQGPVRIEQALIKVASVELPATLLNLFDRTLCQPQMALLGPAEAIADLRRQMTLPPAAQICLEHFENESRNSPAPEAFLAAVKWTLRDILSAQWKGMDGHLFVTAPDRRAEIQHRYEVSTGYIDIHRIASKAVSGQYPNLPKIDTTPHIASSMF